MNAAPSWWPSGGRLAAYGVVLMAFAVGLANLFVLRTPGPVATLLLVVIVSTWFGGTRHGVLAIVLSLGALAYFVSNPSLGVTADLARVVYFALIASFIVWLVTLERRASKSLRRAHDELQRRNEALQRENVAGKALEEILRRSEVELRLVIDTIPTMAWIVLPDGRLEFLNRRWLDYSGMSLDRAVAQGNGTMHPDDLARVMEKWQRAMADATPFEDEMRLRRSDGTYRWFLVRTVPLLGADGIVVRWYGTSTDIEDRKRAEEAARRTEEELRQVIESIPAIAWTARPDGSNEFNNRLWGASTGLSVQQTRGSGWQAAIHPEDTARFVGSWQAAVERGDPFECEARYRRADGTYRWFLVRAVPLRDQTGAIVRWYGVNTEIEDRVRAEQALRGLSRRLVELQEAERKGLARELHDRVGQNLTALKLNIETLQPAIAGLPDGEAAARLADSALLLDSTMDAIENVMSELRPPMLDDYGLGPALQWHATSFARRSGVAVEVRTETSVTRPVPQVEIALFRIAQEALNNIAKHSKARNAVVRLVDAGGEWTMTVEDDGVGFEVVDPAAGRPSPGLGFVTMRERSQAVGGSFEVRALPARGTCLTVRVPA